jgi:sortase A
MRKIALVSGSILVALGLTGIAWGAVTWRWGDPVTALHTKRAQVRLTDELESRRKALLADTEDTKPAAAAGSRARRPAATVLAQRLRLALAEGDAVGRLVVPRLGLDIVVVFGTEDATLRDGPGLHRDTRLPGEGTLVYVAGHRTTYGAPFADLNRLEPGDTATMEMPYGTFRYRVTATTVVDDSDLSVLRATPAEVLRLQACHPRFRASQRLVVSARLVSSTRAPA